MAAPLESPLLAAAEPPRRADLRRAAALPGAFAAGALVGCAVCVVALSPWAQAPRAQPYAPAAPRGAPSPLYLRAPPTNNSCLLPRLPAPPGPQTFDACGFLVRGTDEVWNLRRDAAGAVERLYSKAFVSGGGIWGPRGANKQDVLKAVLATTRAFPDLTVHVTSCTCKGNDVAGYHCATAATLDGTNLGASVYGPATGRFARWTAMSEAVIHKSAAEGQWQHIAEWGVQDEWALVQQLGLDLARVPRREDAEAPLHDCLPWATLREAGLARLNAADLARRQEEAEA